MGFFDEDPFEDIVREFLGGKPSKRYSGEEFISGEDEERTIDFVETKNNFFVIFEIPGYDKEDVHLEIKGNKLIVKAKKNYKEGFEHYMSRKLSQGMTITKLLPSFIKPKKYDYTIKNGILEIAFKK